MNLKTLFSLIIFVITPLFGLTQSRETIILRDNWKFQKGKNDHAFQKQFNDTNWETITVPLDWAIYGPFDKEIDKQEVAILQNGEKKATGKLVEQEHYHMLELHGIATTLHYQLILKRKK